MSTTYSRLTQTELMWATNTTNYFRISPLTTGIVNLYSTGSNTVTLTNLENPVNALDAANKDYVDGLVNGLGWLKPVRAATTVDGDLATAYANGSVIDSVTLVTGDRILLKNQTNAVENGVYEVNPTGAPTRASDMATGFDAAADAMFVEEGFVNADTAFVCTDNSGSALVGTDPLTFTKFASITPGTAAGANTQVQFNNGGNFGASLNFTFTSATDTLAVLGTGSFTTVQTGFLASTGPVVGTIGEFLSGVTAGSSYFNGTVYANSGLSASFVTAGTGSFADLTSGTATFENSLTVNGIANFTTNVNILGSLNVTEEAIFVTNVLIQNGSFTVSNGGTTLAATTILNGLFANNNVYTSDLYATGAVTALTGSFASTVVAASDITSSTGSVIAASNITATNGNISATNGSVSANTTVTAGGNITSTAGNIEATAGSVSAGTSVTASTNITSTSGNISATAGSVSAGTTVTAGTGMTSTTGDITATAGNINATVGSVSAGTTVTAGTGMTSTTGDITASAGNVIASGFVTAAAGWFAGAVTADTGYFISGITAGGPSQFNDTIYVNGSATFTTNVTINGQLILAGGIDFGTSPVTFATATVTGYFDSQGLAVMSATTIAGLAVTSQATVGGSLSVEGEGLFTTNVTVGNLITAGFVTAASGSFAGAVTADTGYFISGVTAGGTSLFTDITVTGTSNLSSTTISGPLLVSANTTFTTNVTINGNLIVNGDIDFNTATASISVGTLAVTGFFESSGNSVMSATTIAGLAVTSQATIGGSLSVVGLASFTTNVIINGELTIAGGINFGTNPVTFSTLTVTNFFNSLDRAVMSATTIAGLAVTSQATVGGSLNVAGEGLFTTNVTVGNLITAGFVTAASGSFAGSLTVGGAGSFATNVTVGNLITSGFVTAASGSFAGNVTAANGIFAGTVAAVNGLYSGAVYATEYYATSDIQYKTNIQSIGSDPLDKLRNIECFSYEWKQSFSQNQQTQYGVIAQQLEEIGLNELVSGTESKAVNYQGLIPLLIASYQQQQKTIEQLQQDIERIKTKKLIPK